MNNYFNLLLTHHGAQIFVPSSVSSSQSKDQMKSAFFLDIVVREGSAVFQLLSSENESLLIRRDTLFVLNFSLDIINSVRGFDIESYSLTSQGLDEDLHSSSKS